MYHLFYIEAILQMEDGESEYPVQLKWKWFGIFFLRCCNHCWYALLLVLLQPLLVRIYYHCCNQVRSECSVARSVVGVQCSDICVSHICDRALFCRAAVICVSYMWMSVVWWVSRCAVICGRSVIGANRASFLFPLLRFWLRRAAINLIELNCKFKQWCRY